MKQKTSALFITLGLLCAVVSFATAQEKTTKKIQEKTTKKMVKARLTMLVKVGEQKAVLRTTDHAFVPYKAYPGKDCSLADEGKMDTEVRDSVARTCTIEGRTVACTCVDTLNLQCKDGAYQTQTIDRVCSSKETLEIPKNDPVDKLFN